jgi:flagellar hook-length control protein FliK
VEAGEQGSRPEAASPTQPAPGTQQADRVRFVQRVARAFAAAADRGGSIRLRLHPPELGSLRLELTIHNGAMTARLEAETETARNLIVENLPALRQRLAEHDIRVERFDVDWSGQSAGNLPQQARDQQAWHPRPGGPGPASAGRSRPAASAPPDPKGVFRPGHGSQFDVVI